MKATTLTDQPAILRLLVEQGCAEVVRSTDAGFPNATALIGDFKNPRRWYVVTIDQGNYTAVILEDCGQLEANIFASGIVAMVAKHIGSISWIDSPAPTPQKN